MGTGDGTTVMIICVSYLINGVKARVGCFIDYAKLLLFGEVLDVGGPKHAMRSKGNHMSLRPDGWSILNVVVRGEDLFHNSRLGKLSSKMMVVVVAQLSTRCLLKEIKTYVQ